MQSLHKNENLLFKDFQDFLVRSQQLPQKRIPFYLRWVNRFHEFCYFGPNLDRLAKRKQGALKKTGVEGGLLQGVEGALDLIRLSPVLSGVFF